VLVAVRDQCRVDTLLTSGLSPRRIGSIGFRWPGATTAAPPVLTTLRVSPYRIELATEAHDRAIGELLVDAFEKTYARKLPEVVMSDRRRADLRAVAEKRKVARVWVATCGDEVVGTVAVWAAGAPGSEAWLPNAASLRHLAVAEAHRGSGLSSKLMDAAEAWVRAQRMKAVCLHVRRRVSGVAKFYLQRGYARTPEGDLDLLPEVFLEAFVLKL
jgi:predicted N-acetyltransferase YhbS